MSPSTIAPKKSLGQNFLTDTNILGSIADALNLKAGEDALEIGPGHGTLTKILLDRGIKVTAIEKDSRLIPELSKKFLKELEQGQLHIQEGDALELTAQDIPKNPYVIVGNIPYYITGHLLRIISELSHKPTTTVLTIQKEVAKRICAQPPQMNLLAAATQVWADPHIEMHISRKKFNPQPKVDSSVLKLLTKNNTVPVMYYPLIKKLFAHPRKTVNNNLREASFVINKLERYGINHQTRPQNLSIDTIIRLAENISVRGG